ncbi:MAG: metallophosphoesterase [Oscillospiraceae bacterium]|jgi:predicted phosphodiesterase/2-phosphoglycerate kinase|nr:metallophosphoesterase [Oscillospiraceae bacterium]
MSKFSWLHFSDLHYSSDMGISQDMFKEALYKCLKKIREETKEDIDYIFITGDVANKEVYEDNLKDNIKAIISSIEDDQNIQEEPKKIFWVIGNHDIERNPKRTEEILKIRNSPTPQVAFNTAMADDLAQFILGSLGTKKYIENVSEFSKEFSSYATVEKGSHNQELHRIIKLNDVNIIMLNTCLTSCDNDDNGNLFVLDEVFVKDFDSVFSENFVNEMIKDKKTTFVLAHHGFESLNKIELSTLREKFAGKVDLWLCGHSHELMYNKFYDPDSDDNGQKQNTIHQYTCGQGKLDDKLTPTFIYGVYDDGMITITPYKFNGFNWEEYKGSQTRKQIEFDRFKHNYFKHNYILKNNNFKLFITGVQSAGKTTVSKRLLNRLKNSEALQTVEVNFIKDVLREDVQRIQNKLFDHELDFKNYDVILESDELCNALLETSYNLPPEKLDIQSKYIFPRLMSAVERHTKKGIPAIIEGLNINVEELIEYYKNKAKEDNSFDINSVMIINLTLENEELLRKHLESRIKDRGIEGDEKEKQENDLEGLWKIHEYYKNRVEKVKSEISELGITVKNVDNSGMEDKDVAVREIIKLINETKNFKDD